jgi:hypothetical protein
MTQLTAKAQTPAERARRFRYRRKHNLLMARVEVPAPLAEALIDSGMLFEEDASDPQALGGALVEAAERFIDGGR